MCIRDRVIIDYPTIEEEKLIIRENIQGGLPTVTPVTTAEEILKARSIVNEDVYKRQPFHRGI